MFSDKNATSTPLKNNMVLSQELQRLAINLECAKQEIQIMKLEKIEYEKEIEQLRQQNKTLIQDNHSCHESCELGIQEMQFLRKCTNDLSIINDTNYDLHTQISQYKQLVKQLQSENIQCKEQNENYETLLETLTQQNEIRENVHSNTALQLQYRIKQLENENDTLTQELNDIKLLQTYACSDKSDTSSEIEEKQSENNLLKERRNSDIINIKYRRDSRQHDNNYEKPLFFELENVFDSDYSEESVFILKQLLQFGYNENDIINALNEANNKDDINEIVENIEKKADCKCDIELGLEVETQIKEMEKLKNINKQSKIIIDKLQKKIKLLREKNQKLNTRKKVRQNESCFTWWSK